MTPNAISRNENEQPPDVVATKRWKKALPTRARKATKKRGASKQIRVS